MSRPSAELRLYTCAEVATELGILPRAARELFNRRELPLVRIGRRLYVRHVDLVAYLDARTEQAGSRDGGEDR